MSNEQDLQRIMRAPRAAILKALGLPPNDTATPYENLWSQFAALALAGGGSPAGNVIFDAVPENPAVNSLYWLPEPLPVNATTADVRYAAALEKWPNVNGDIADNTASVDPSAWNTRFKHEPVGFFAGTISSVMALANASTGSDVLSVDDGGEADALAVYSLLGRFAIVASSDFTVNGIACKGGSWYELGVIENGRYDGTITPADVKWFAGEWQFSQEDIDAGFVAALFEITIPVGPIYFDGDNWIPLTLPSDSGESPDMSGLEARLASIEDALSSLNAVAAEVAGGDGEDDE